MTNTTIMAALAKSTSFVNTYIESECREETRCTPFITNRKNARVPSTKRRDKQWRKTGAILSLKDLLGIPTTYLKPFLENLTTGASLQVLTLTDRFLLPRSSLEAFLSE